MVYQLQRAKDAQLSASQDLTGDKNTTPDKSFKVIRPTYTENMDLSALIAACEEICESLDGTVKTDVLSVPTAKASPGGLHSKSTVSIV